MKSLSLFVALGCLVVHVGCSDNGAPSGAQSPPPTDVPTDASPPPIATGAIEGTVTDANQLPLGGVTISTNPGSVSAVSSATGAFTLPGVPIGDYTVLANKGGYAPYALGDVGVAAKGTTTVHLTLTASSDAPSTVSGVVTDSKHPGGPVAGAVVQVEGQSTTTTTDANGAFTLTGVTPGPVFLSVTPPDPGKLLPTETRSAIMVSPATTIAGVTLVLSARPSDAAKYVGMETECVACHNASNGITGDQTSAVRSSAHYRSLTRIARDTSGRALPGAFARMLDGPLTKPRTVMIPLPGTIAVPAGTVVTGSGTAFVSGGATALRAGDKLGYTPKGLGWTPIGVIASVDGDTQITLTASATFAPGVTSLPAGTAYSVERLSSTGHLRMLPDGASDIVAPGWPGVKATNPNYDPNDPCVYGAITSGTCAAGGTGPYPDGQVNVYVCNLKGSTVQGVTYTNDEYVQKFGGSPFTCSDGTFWDGVTTPAVPMVRILVIYGGQGDKDGAMAPHPNMGVFKQRFQGSVADVKSAAAWTPPYATTADRDRDSLTLPIQVLESGDRANGVYKMNGYHPSEQKFPGESWSQRTRTFSHACAGCHSTGLTIDYAMTTIDLPIPRDRTIKQMTNAAITAFNYQDENVTCEHCHGPASEHVQNGGGAGQGIINPKYLTAESERQLCGKCHGYDDGNNNNPRQTYGFEYPWNSDWKDKIGNGNFVPGVTKLADALDNLDEAKDDEEAFWDPAVTGGKLYGQAHRQQYLMLSFSGHVNNPYVKTTCTSCHDGHSLYKTTAKVVSSANEQYALIAADYTTNVACLGCHAGGGALPFMSGGPFASVSKQDVATVHLALGGQALKNGAAMAMPSQDDVTAAKARVADAVGAHMMATTKMGNVIYDPTNDAMPTGRCTSCHMPKVAKSGGYVMGQDATGNEAIVEGDQASHVFSVVWPWQSTALSNGGATFQSGYYGQTFSATNVKYDKFGYMPNSCSKCHAGARKASVLCPDTSNVWPSFWPLNDPTADPNMSWVTSNCATSKNAP